MARGASAPRWPFITTLQDWRGAFFKFVNTNGQEAKHIVMDAHVAFHFTDGGGWPVNVEKGVMPFPVFLDPVGQITQAPCFLFGNGSAGFDDNFREGLGQGFCLGRGNILTCDKHVFIKRHVTLLMVVPGAVPYPSWLAFRP